MKNLSALIGGLLFGLGLALSQMTNPEKVLGFLDVLGDWDPTLIFVMGGALITTTLGYFLVLKRPQPLWEQNFQLPQDQKLSRPLIFGSILFGIGWGISGYCPGPAVANLAINPIEAFWFVGALMLGFWVAKSLQHRSD